MATLWMVLPGCGYVWETSAPPLPPLPLRPPRVPVADEIAVEEEEVPEPPDAPLPFRVPKDYVAERVAGPPLTRHPMFASFDDQGRLYVAGSSGRQMSRDERLATPPDVIRCLEDTDGDGRFDKSAVFADGLTYPQGILWHDGAVYTASPPSLWRLEDTDGDGKADRRAELVTGFAFTGIADDLHGPCLGPDGRLYWGCGRFDHEIHKPGGPLIKRGYTPLILRCRPDGGDVEVYSAAMGNPVEVAFTPEGDPFASGTFLSPQSQGAGLRDALIQCVEGGLYSIRDRELAGEARTGDLLPPLAQLGVAAASGLAMPRGGLFGDLRSPTLYAAMFNLHSVTRHVLTRDGATFRAREEPFLTSEVQDFHPTDVLEDADGSLLVVDTGGWFRACPTSQIGKLNVLGGIYRISRRGARRPRDPRGRSIAWDSLTPADLARRLSDPRFAVRDRAVASLAKLGEDAMPELRKVLRGGAPRARLRALWALAQIDADEARAATRAALGDASAGVRQAAAAAAGLHRDFRALGRLKAMVQSDAPPVRLQAAAALGRLGSPDSVPAVLAGLRGVGDRFLEHALVYALIRINEPRPTHAGLADKDPEVRRGALIALDQMKKGDLTLDRIAPLLDAPEPELRRAALGVVAAHPEWAGAMAGTLRRWLAGAGERASIGEVRAQLLAFSRDPDVRTVMAEAMGRKSTPPATRVMLLEVAAATLAGEWPASWDAAVRKCLEDRDESVARAAVGALHASGRKGFDASLIALGRDPTRSDDLRVEALDVVARALRGVEAPLYEFLTAQLSLGVPPLRKLAAARALGRAPLDDGQLLALAGKGAAAGIMTLTRLLPAFERSHSPAVGNALLAAVGESPAFHGLAREELERVVRAYPEDVRHKAETLFRRIEQHDGQREARLASLEPLLSRGDAARGREVFFGTRAVCSTCHTVRGEGGQVGPDLSKIGAARSGRDLLEAVLYPSASFARGYEPYVVATDDGLVHNGVIARESASAIVLVTPDRLETWIPRSTVEEITPGRVSVMPQGLDANLGQDEFADLLAFLRSLK